MAKKYYWLKLKNNFFTQPRIKKLRKIAGGDTYTIIYLKMQLLSIQDDGKLYFEGIESDFAEEIALIIDEDVENVKVTINYLLAQGLLVEAGNEFTLPEAQESIGSETESAERMRKKRLKERNLLPNPSHCDATVTQCDTEIEIEKEIELDKEIDKEIDNKKPTRHKYGEYGNVLLSDKDFEKLKEEFPNDWEERVERLSSYMASTGKSYKNHLATIRNWARREKNDNTRKDPGTVRQDRKTKKTEIDYGNSHGLKMA